MEYLNFLKIFFRLINNVQDKLEARLDKMEREHRVTVVDLNKKIDDLNEKLQNKENEENNIKKVNLPTALSVSD